MDSGQIDFYQHDKVCTNTCRSTKFDLLISSARAPVPGQQSVVQTPTSADGRKPVTNAMGTLPSDAPLPPTHALHLLPGHIRAVPPGDCSGFWEGKCFSCLFGEVLAASVRELCSAGLGRLENSWHQAAAFQRGSLHSQEED